METVFTGVNCDSGDETDGAFAGTCREREVVGGSLNGEGCGRIRCWKGVTISRVL